MYFHSILQFQKIIKLFFLSNASKKIKLFDTVITFLNKLKLILDNIITKEFIDEN